MSANLFTVGIDIGSTASKCVVLSDGKDIVARSVIPVGAGTTGPARAMAQALSDCGKTISDMASVCSTGYGRHSFPDATFEVSELSCHAKGVCALFPDVRTIIDIGGQDIKAMKIGPDHRLINFMMNDKCAAGTGRFLEVMARVLEVQVADLSELGSKSTKTVDISSTCTVFAESEVISQLSGGVAIPDLVAGIHRSVARRVVGLVKRLGIEEQVVMSGGVAKNTVVVSRLESALGVKIVTSPLAQLDGAFGAAIFAHEKAAEQLAAA